jgi:glycosyltransferase involved in cell wall biosynthesis
MGPRHWSSGGAQKYVADLAVGAKLAGHEVYVATGVQKEKKDNWLFDVLRENGFQNENLFEIKNHVREINLLKDVKGLFEFIKILKQVQPDVVHLNSSKAGFVGAVGGFFVKAFTKKPPKTLYTVHGFVFLEPMNVLKKYFFILLEFISSKLRNLIIFITEKDIEVAKKFGILTTSSQYQLVYNGVDESKKENILSREESRKFIFEKIGKKDEGQKIVGTISNLFKTKGLEYLIDAAKRVDALFVVFGFGDEKYRQELQERINKNGLQNNFFLLGRVPDVYRYLRGLDVFTLTSVKEGLPYSILEASLANLPIVATSVGGVPEVAKNIKISLVESKNVEQITNAIIKNLEVENLEKNKSSFNEIYTIENMVAQTLQVYQNMLN